MGVEGGGDDDCMLTYAVTFRSLRSDAHTAKDSVEPLSVHNRICHLVFTVSTIHGVSMVTNLG